MIPAVNDDLGRVAILDPLFDALTPSSVLVCWMDHAPVPDRGAPSAGDAAVTSCTPEQIGEALGRGETPDVIWLGGYPNWHSIAALADDLTSHLGTRPSDPPVLVVEGGRADPMPAWVRNDTYAAQLDRMESSKEGIRSGVADLAERLDSGAMLLWCAPGRGTAALVPAVVARRLEPWLAGHRVVLDAMSATHHRSTRLVGQNFALLELLEGAQRSGDAVVRSLRFRVGTRLVRLARRFARKEKEAVFRAPRQILARDALVEQWRARLGAERDSEDSVPAPGALKVTYVLPQLRLTGGALVVIDLVNELRLLGVDARIATLEARGDVYRTRFLDRPIVFGDVPTMMREMPEVDVLVATHWSTAAWVRDLVDAGRARNAAYLVQDYEEWFYPEDDVKTRAAVKRTYGLIPHRIVTSDWLRDLLAADGYPARKVPPGLDLGVFYPRRVERPRRPVILAMARPRTPRRGFDTVVAALTKVHEAMPSVEIVLFGENLGEMALPFPYRGEGVVTGQERLARLYSQAHVHLDASDFQAFGKAALEAMACGTPSVLTGVGGVNEFAHDEENCLLVSPRDPDATSRAILRLASESPLHRRLREVGLATVRDYSIKAKARDILRLFEEIVESGRGTQAAQASS